MTDGCLDYDCWSHECEACKYLEGPAEGGAYWPAELDGEIDWYWSSSPVADDDRAFRVSFYTGGVNYDYNDHYGNYFEDYIIDGYLRRVRCVR